MNYFITYTIAPNHRKYSHMIQSFEVTLKEPIRSMKDILKIQALLLKSLNEANHNVKSVAIIGWQRFETKF
jgi:hypothetical protein